MVWVYIVSHVLAVGLGYMAGHYAIHRAIRTVIGKTAPEAALKEEALTVTDQTKYRTALGFWLLIAATVLVGIGVQSFLAQKNNEDQARQRDANYECLTEWSEDFTYAIEQRSNVNDDVTQARRDRETSLDAILMLVYQASIKPDSVENEDFTDALAAFVESRQALADALDAQSSAREDAPYPPAPSVICKEK